MDFSGLNDIFNIRYAIQVSALYDKLDRTYEVFITLRTTGYTSKLTI